MKKLRLSKPKKSNAKGSFEAFENAKLTQQGRKLLKEWKKIDKLCDKNEVIAYIIRNRNREGLPVEYEIIYTLNSIVGIEDDGHEVIADDETTFRNPIYGNKHRLSIVLPNNYPSALGGNPEFKMSSDTWHPNIRATGKFKGRICLNNKDLGIGVGLDARILRVGKYLQFQIYWATDSYPWPEDKTVAEWIREEAEPMGWVNVDEGIFTDTSNLNAKEGSAPRENIPKGQGQSFTKTKTESPVKEVEKETIQRKTEETVQSDERIEQSETQETVQSDERVESLEKKVLRLEAILGGAEKKKAPSKAPIQRTSESKMSARVSPSGRKELRLESIVSSERNSSQGKIERIKAEKREKERLERERLEKERVEKERIEAERLEQERIESQRLEQERIEKEEIESQRLEQERIEKEKIENQRLEQERIEKEKIENQRLEQERIEKERVESQRLEQERIENERIENQRLEQERIENERIESQRLEQERLEKERVESQQLEQERIEKEKTESQQL
ncbi:MAG: hypothetical protein DRJ05_17760, partial [Bacteroidetes bacterium]